MDSDQPGRDELASGILQPREIRDVVAYLASLKGESKKSVADDDHETE